MFKDLQNNYSKILCFFVCILIIIKTICICHVSALVGDDILFTYLTVPFGADDETLNASSFDLMVNQFSNLLNEYNSGLVSHFLQKFFHMFLPIFLGIHPEDFVFIPLSIFKGIIFFCIIYLMSNFSQIQLKNKKIELSVLMFLSIIIFIFTKYNYPNIFNNGVNFYSYSLSILFYCIFIHYIIKNIIKNKKTSILELILIMLNVIILANCSSVTSFITTFTLFLIMTYNVGLYLFKKMKIISINTYEKIKFHLNKNFFISTFTFFITLISMWCFTNIYRCGIDGRAINYSEINFAEIINFLKVFANEYSCIFIYFIILAIIVPILLRKNLLNIRLISFSLIIQLSILATICGLFFSGKEIHMDIYWIEVQTIALTIKYISIIPVIILINNIRLLTKNCKKRQLLFCGIFILSFVIFSNNFFKEIINIKKNFSKIKSCYDYRTVRYIEEKMLRFYYLKNETPILPKEELSIYSIYEPHMVNKGCMRDHWIANRYYPIVYGDTKFINGEICFQENAMEQFIKKGGRIYKFEIEDIDFSRLYDDDFILNKNMNINDINTVYKENQTFEILQFND